MTADFPWERRFERLENEDLAIYDLLMNTRRKLRREIRRVDATLAEHITILDQHTATLAEHGATLAEHTAILDQHSATLAEHTLTLDQHTATLAEHTATFEQHGLALARLESGMTEVLRRLPEPA